MRCSTFVFAFELVVTLPNDTSVIRVVGVPYLGAEEPTAVTTDKL